MIMMIWAAIYLAGFAFTVGMSVYVYHASDSEVGSEVWVMSAIWPFALMMVAGLLFAQWLRPRQEASRTARHDKT